MSAANGVEVRRSPIHGRGVFALRRFRGGEVIGEAAGSPTRRDGAYVLWLRDGSGVAVKNAFRFVNHSLRPNAEFDGTIVRALRAIPAGREITAHYGDDWADVG